MSNRPPLPHHRLGNDNPTEIVSQAQTQRIYFLRVATATARALPFDPVTGLGLHARLVQVQSRACGGMDQINENETDWGGNDVPAPAAGTHKRGSVERPFWDLDFDRGLWIPKGFMCSIGVVGGYEEPAGPTIDSFIAYRSHEISPSETAPPWRLTYAHAPAGRTITLVDGPLAPPSPSPIDYAEVHGAVSVVTPMANAAISLIYSTGKVAAITAAPGIPISLAGCVAVTPATPGQWIFEVRL